jgi:hypothetical protein
MWECKILQSDEKIPLEAIEAELNGSGASAGSWSASTARSPS